MVAEIGTIESFSMISRYGNESLYITSSGGFNTPNIYVLLKGMFLLFKEMGIIDVPGYELPDGTTVPCPIPDFEDDALDYYPTDYAHACLARYFTIRQGMNYNGFNPVYALLSDSTKMNSIQENDIWQCAFFSQRPEWGSVEDGYYKVE